MPTLPRLSEIILVVLGPLVLSAALPLAASAGTTYSDTVSAVEVAATDTAGTFMGEASGQLPGAFATTVIHDPLAGSAPWLTRIDAGGSLQLSTVLNGRPVVIGGSYTGGTIQQLTGMAGCRNQTYHIDAGLAVAGSAAQNGAFSGTLTHYRVQLFGRCVTFGASLTGGVRLTLSGGIAAAVVSGDTLR